MSGNGGSAVAVVVERADERGNVRESILLAGDAPLFERNSAMRTNDNEGIVIVSFRSVSDRSSVTVAPLVGVPKVEIRVGPWREQRRVSRKMRGQDGLTCLSSFHGQFRRERDARTLWSHLDDGMFIIGMIMVGERFLLFLHHVLPIDFIASLFSFKLLRWFFMIFPSSFLIAFVVLHFSHVSLPFSRLEPLLLTLQDHLSFTFHLECRRRWRIIDQIENQTVGFLRSLLFDALFGHFHDGRCRDASRKGQWLGRECGSTRDTCSTGIDHLIVNFFLFHGETCQYLAERMSYF